MSWEERCRTIAGAYWRLKVKGYLRIDNDDPSYVDSSTAEHLESLINEVVTYCRQHPRSSGLQEAFDAIKTD